MTFSSLGLDPRLLRAIDELGFTVPTAIQQLAIPPALEGRDVLACAVTGSGKTAAFVLPILQRLAGKKHPGTRALIVTPTRELAAQIHEHIGELARHVGIHSAAVYGGVGMGPQERALRSGTAIVVVTPGRFLDHMRQGSVRMNDLEVLVLDEADRMLDMGFLPDVRRILRVLPTERQTLFFSATMPPPIAALSREMLKHPTMINVERKALPAASITQSIYPVRGDQKSALLVDLLKSRDDMESVLVFTRTKHRANRLADFLADRSVPSARIHGNRSQSQREAALEGFKAGRFRVLVATDIAARGIDVTDLSHVVNYDVPHVPEDYIHRVGRTGRASATGEAFTFVSPEEESDLRQIEKAIGNRIPRVGHERSAPARHETGAKAEPEGGEERPRTSHGHAHPKSHAKPHAKPHAAPHARPHAKPHTSGHDHAPRDRHPAAGRDHASSRDHAPAAKHGHGSAPRGGSHGHSHSDGERRGPPHAGGHKPAHGGSSSAAHGHASSSSAHGPSHHGPAPSTRSHGGPARPFTGPSHRGPRGSRRPSRPAR